MDEIILTDDYIEKEDLVNYESSLEKKRWGILIAVFLYML